jgi:hypothetical protein
MYLIRLIKQFIPHITEQISNFTQLLHIALLYEYLVIRDLVILYHTIVFSIPWYRPEDDSV